MPANYVLLEKITVGAAGASSVTFSGIPQTGYTDLVVKASVRNTSTESNNQIYVQPNAATTNLSSRVIVGTGSAALSAAYTSDSSLWGYCTGNGSTSNTFSNSEFYFPNYASANYKSVSIDSVNETNATDARQIMNASLWSSTTAISSLKFLTIENSTGNPKDFVQGSTFYLYGVAKLGTTPAIVPYATGGDTIMTDGTYWYHTFVSSGTFTPQKGLSCDYLVVAGGGGGAGQFAAAGGGAGGYRTSIGGSALSLGTSAYTVTIGGGGAGGVGDQVGANGSNSVFSTITSSGGGRGGSAGLPENGSTGGSGGGGAGLYNGALGGQGAAGNSGSYSPVEGYAGGNGNNPSSFALAGGGGGGSSAAGANGTGSGGGNGGNGTANSISGSSVTYAGGGGGGGNGGFNGVLPGTGGTGGGGNGGNKVAGSPGTANTGGGGGAGSSDSGNVAVNGGAGGSGIVIVRYAV
jgi:hypothetical protein